MRLAIAFATLLTAPALANPITLIPSDALDWQKTPEGVAFAALEGDRFTAPYQAMVELPAGTISPLHVKSANMFGVMIAGEMIHYTAHQNPDDALRVGPGAFYKVPSGLAHVSACVSATPCVAYLYQDGAFDFVPVPE